MLTNIGGKNIEFIYLTMKFHILILIFIIITTFIHPILFSQNYLTESGLDVPIWSDFTSSGSTKEDFQNGDSKTTNILDLDYAWKEGATFDKQCVQMKAENDFSLGKSNTVC